MLLRGLFEQIEKCGLFEQSEKCAVCAASLETFDCEQESP
jgi:hypothetical protein